jgi:protein-arginine kinase activator protein McsA
MAEDCLGCREEATIGLTLLHSAGATHIPLCAQCAEKVRAHDGETWYNIHLNHRKKQYGF